MVGWLPRARGSPRFSTGLPDNESAKGGGSPLFYTALLDKESAEGEPPVLHRPPGQWKHRGRGEPPILHSPRQGKRTQHPRPTKRRRRAEPAVLPPRPLSQPSWRTSTSRADGKDSDHGTEGSLLNQPQDKRFHPTRCSWWVLLPHLAPSLSAIIRHHPLHPFVWRCLGPPNEERIWRQKGCQAVKWASQEGKGKLGMCQSSTQAATLCKTSPG